MVLGQFEIVLEALEIYIHTIWTPMYDMLQMIVMRVIHNILQWIRFLINVCEGQTLGKILNVFQSMHMESLALALFMGLLGTMTMFNLLKLLPFFLPSRQRLLLPPGSMGLPFFGETFRLKSQQHDFYLTKQKEWVYQVTQTHW